MTRAFLALGVVGAIALGGCTSSDPLPLTVFGASSLTTALEQLANQYSVAHLVVSTGSSATLRAQIEQGAPADVFLSADTSNPQALVDGGHADGETVAFATNKLTIVVPEGNPGGITSPADLAREDVTIIAAGEEVPITKYAEQAIDQLAALPGSPFEFAAAYEANIASREDNVGAVTSKIELGEGDAAIVYVTDAAAAELETVDIPPEANVVATYAGIVTSSSAVKTQAHAFLDWLRQPTAQRILGGLGFQLTP
jgi:molybdate transport system substrate-binding protein